MALRRFGFTIVLLALVVTACAGVGQDGESAPMMGRDMGPGSGMMARHNATVPEPYAGQVNPVAADADSLARGAEIYTARCAVCHGDGGMGDGPAVQGFDPAPAPVAHTSRMLGDDYLFWRVSVGGAPFATAMPAWESVLSERERWDVINYVRALGSGEMAPGEMHGGAAYDPEGELRQRTAMLATAVAEGVISQAEADLFNSVHTALDALPPEARAGMQGGMGQMETAMLQQLVTSGAITAEDAAAFESIHGRLLEAGLMR